MVSFRYGGVTEARGAAATLLVILWFPSCCLAFVSVHHRQHGQLDQLGQHQRQQHHLHRPLSTTSSQSLRHTNPFQSYSSTRSTTSLLQMSPLLSDVSSSSAATAWNSPLMTFFLETLISNGVPALFTILVVGFVALQFRRKRDDTSFGDDNDEEWYEGNVVSELYNDLYGDGGGSSSGSGGGGSPFQGLRRLLQKSRRNKRSKNDPEALNFLNLGIPSEQYFRITHLNRKLDSYQYSLTAATNSKAKAAANYRALNFQRAIQRGFESSGYTGNAWNTTLSQQTALILTEKDFLDRGKKIMAKLQSLQTQLTQWAIDEELYYKFGQMTPDVLDPDPSLHIHKKKNASSSSSKFSSLLSKQSKKELDSDRRQRDLLQKEWAKYQQALLQLELEFVQEVVGILGPERANGIRTALLGNGGVVGTLLLQLQERPLRTLLYPDIAVDFAEATNNGDDTSSTTPKDNSSTTSTAAKVEIVTITAADNPMNKRLYVANFDGDVTASQVANLREEVTAIVRHARPGIDEALVILQTGGGTVTGYGLAAAQLVRLREHGLKLTIAAEQVAASGGYMMCCVADHIVASPFCVLGSIGVISDIPNVYERLKQEGIEFQTVTAGKYKRTLTPTKKITKEDAEKTKEDLEAVLSLFRNFVKTYRPQLDIEKVATGETWFGTDALERGLCDEIKPVDDVLMNFMDRGYNVYELEYSPPPESGLEFGRLLPIGGKSDSSRSENGGGLLNGAIRWLVRTIATEVRAELKGMSQDIIPNETSMKRKYMLMDDSSERIRADD